MIKLQTIGHIGRDAQLNNVNGRNVINFNIAHSEKFKDSQGNLKEKTTWVSCAHWTERTGILPYLTKGTLVYVEGTPDTKIYEGNVQLTLRVTSIQLLGRGEKKDDTNITQPVDDLPF